MSNIASIFQTLKQQKKSAFVPFIMGGDGGLENTFSLMRTLAENGADIIELGVAFSDPMADGAVIQKAHERALGGGVNLADILDLVRKFKNDYPEIGVVLMGYLNPIEIFGYRNFAKAAAAAGVDGVLVVDLPPEESSDLKTELDRTGVDFIFLVAPTTSEKRLRLLADSASGFLYFIALKGTTGADHLDLAAVASKLEKMRTFCDLPLGVGFGIKDAKTAATLHKKGADAIIIGSALVALAAKYQHDSKAMIEQVGRFAQSFREVLG